MELSVQQSMPSLYLLDVKCNNEIIEEMHFFPIYLVPGTTPQQCYGRE